MKKENNEMQNFYQGTTWLAIVLIAFGLVTEILKNNFTTWFIFGFFCFIGLCQWAYNRNK